MGDMLKDRVAVITGAGNGLGKAYAMGMAKQGARRDSTRGIVRAHSSIK